MKHLEAWTRFVALLGLTLLIWSGCESTEESSVQVSGGVYYGVGYYDPWYYGSGYYPPDVIVTPPGRPSDRPHVEQPIARPPAASVSPRPMPSIPSMPRASFRR